MSKPVLESLRTLASLCLRALFRMRIDGLENYSGKGNGTGTLIIANHVSLLDGVVLFLVLPGPMTFAVNAALAQRWYSKLLLRFVEYRELDNLNPVALKSMVRELRDGRNLVIFPEGQASTTGTMMKVYEGPGLIADKADAAIVPIGIEGLQYSRFSRLKGLYRLRWFPRVTIKVLPIQRLDLDPALKGAERRSAATGRITAIMREIAFANAYRSESVFDALVHAAKTHGRRLVILKDATGAALSYGDLITRSFVLGSVIARLTSRKERVGLMLPSTAAAAVTLFACLARGRQVAMLNFTGGTRGLVTALETASVNVVLTSRAFIAVAGLEAEAEALSQHANLVYLEDLREKVGLSHKLSGLLAARVATLAHRMLGHVDSPDDPAIVLFTSGSEGIPKGVVLSHANLIANYAQVQMLIDISRRDQVLNVLPVFHAFGLLGGLLLPLFKGTPTFQYPSPLHHRIIPQLCYELGVTCLFGTTTFLRAYGRSAEPYDFHTMRFVISGAERMTEETQRLWNERFGIRIFEGYGTTEASPVLAVNNPLACRPGSVGQLVAGVEHYIAPVEGIASGGELVVRGPNVMLGYLFHGSDGEIIQPWTEARGPGWYETGDIVEVSNDGYVTIKGRAKRFAKIGGEMVSLAAVEELAASRWPDGQHAALALSDPRKGEQIVLVTNIAEASRSELVVTARAARLNELVVPKKIVHRAELPLLGSGKLDYTTLREQMLRADPTGPGA